MFGHTDNQQQTDNNFVQGQPAADPAFSSSQVFNDTANAGDSSVQDNTTSPFSEIPSQSPAVTTDSSPFSLPITPANPVLPATDDVAVPTTAPVTADDTSTDDVAADHTELLDIKQQALQQLSPLVSHLDQTPEDKFKTTMMMIQASDDHALLPEAYKAAQAITDEKAKAQALLDVVNEINYFTQGQ